MDWQSIAAILVPIITVLGWIWSRIDRKFDKLENKFELRFDKIDLKFEKVEREISELRTSLNRMEGAFYSKDCCMLKEDKHKKAE